MRDILLGVPHRATDLCAVLGELRPDIRLDTVTAERFGRLRAAYDTLRDPGQRAAYDRERTVPPPAPARPVRRVMAVRLAGDVPPPEPPLRAGPVRWERTF